MTLLTELIDILKKDSRLVSNDELLKNQIVELALKLDIDLIKLLLSNEKIKEHFFVDVNGTLVFNTEKFMKFVNNKEFLPDSYTAFKNKIGLTLGKNYLAKSKEVVLAWPYKDCVLEGGQEKEDEKRDEIFHNEILAPDEIDRLLEPKVLTNFKKFDSTGENEVTEIKLDDNLIVFGNNLLVLHSLKKKFAKKIRLVYIDPPYNTGGDSFKYNDNFNHSTWLTFMKNRLEIARQLLRKDGFIIVQCDDNEASYLKVLMDEIFQKKNYLVTFYVQVRYEKKTLAEDNDFQKVIEQCLVYARDSGNSKPNKDVEDYSIQKFEWEIVEKKLGKEIELGGKKAEVFSSDAFEIKKVAPNINGLKETWATGSIVRQKGSSGEFLASYITPRKEIDGLGCLYKVYDIGEDGLGFRYFTGPRRANAIRGKFYSGIPLERVAELKVGKSKKEIPISNYHNFSGDFGNCRHEGSVDIKGGKKPEKLIHFLLKHFSNEGDIVLDYHVGSGTTCGVAHKMKRQYIGVEQLDYGSNDVITRLKNVIGKESIEEETGNVIEYDNTGISKETVWKGGGSFIYCELKKQNEEFVEKIKMSQSKPDLLKIWENAKENGFLSYRVDKRLFDRNIEEFKELTLEEQKRILLDCLEVNDLYVNYSEIKDEQYAIHSDEIAINQKFYGDL